MKKLVLALGVCAVSFSAIAMQSVTPTTATVTQVATQDEYKEIKVADLPTAVSQAFTKAFPDGSIDKAYVNAEKIFKLSVTTPEGSQTLYANEKGEWVKP